MRTSINLPDEVIATVRDRAAADGISPAPLLGQVSSWFGIYQFDTN